MGNGGRLSCLLEGVGITLSLIGMFALGFYFGRTAGRVKSGIRPRMKNPESEER
jgi:hypothetical protein